MANEGFENCFEQARGQIVPKDEEESKSTKSNKSLQEQEVPRVHYNASVSDGASAATSQATSRTGKSVTINLESVILLENKLFRIANNVKTMRQLKNPNAGLAALNAYAA